jgi:REP element-mobilizing transposase RayT
MPQYQRSFVEGGTYFFTIVFHDCAPILTGNKVRAGRNISWGMHWGACGS